MHTLNLRNYLKHQKQRDKSKVVVQVLQCKLMSNGKISWRQSKEKGRVELLKTEVNIRVNLHTPQ